MIAEKFYIEKFLTRAEADRLLMFSPSLPPTRKSYPALGESLALRFTWQLHRVPEFAHRERLRPLVAAS